MQVDNEVVRQNALLREELAKCRNEAEIASINYEQSAKAMEEHFAALSEEHEKLSAARSVLMQEKESLTKELTETKASKNALHAQLVTKDLALEEKLASVEGLHLEKRALDRRLEFSQEEVADCERQLRLAQEKIVVMTAENSALDAEAQEAKATQRRIELEKNQVQQVKDNLAASNKWLEDNMSHLGESLKSERQRSTQEIMELQGRFQQADAQVQVLEQTVGQLRARLEQKQRTVEELQGKLKEEKMLTVSKEEQFEKELGVAQKLAALYKGHCEKRTAEAAELESVVRDLRRHVQELSEAHLAATEKLELAVSEAHRKLMEEKEKSERMLQAAANGRFSPATPEAPRMAVKQANGSPEQLTPLPAASANVSKTELYIMYTEATSSWKEERHKRRQNEIILEQLCAEIEKKAVLVKEQQVEYDRVQAAYTQMTASLDHASHEKRHAEAMALDLKAQIRSDEKAKAALEQQVQDLNFQISVLLNQKQRSSGPHLSNGNSQQASISSGRSEDSSGRVMTADDAISRHLLSFSDIQELQDLNQRQTAIIRDLSAQQENAAAEMRADLEAERERLRKKVELDIAFNRNQRREQEDLVQQIARQRDMFRKLLQDAAAAPRRANGATDLQLIAAADAQLAGNTALQGPEEPDYQKLYADLEKELEKVKEDAAENARLLRDEATKAKEAASVARAEKARSQADAAFEKQRAERQAEHAEEQRLQMQQAAEHSSKYQGMMINLQNRLSTSVAETQQAQQNASAQERKLHALEVEKTLATNAEQRLSASISQLSSEKHAVEADLKALRAELGRKEEKAASERARLSMELAQARQAEMDAVKDLSQAQKRARDAAAAKEVIQMQAEDRIAKAVKTAEDNQKAASEALQRAASSQGKVEVLQKALQKAEERAANLEFQRSSGTQAGAAAQSADGTDASGNSAEAKLAGEVKLLKEQLMSAYEKAAEATSRIAQYQALAESSNQALEAMQADHEAFKAEANKRSAASKEECRGLHEQLSVANKEATDLQQELRRLQDTEREAAIAQTAGHAKSAEDLRRLQQALEDKDAQIASMNKDLDFWRQRFNAAEERAQREVIDHAATIKQLQTADAALTRLEEKLNEGLQAKLEAEAKQASAEEDLKSRVSQSEAAIAIAERKSGQIEQQNKILHEQLERMALQMPTGGEGGELAGVISFLRQQLEVLEEEKALAMHEADRLRGETQVLRRTVDSLRAQLSSEEDRQQRAAQDEALFRERRESQANFNMVKESNASLRLQNEELDKQVRGLKSEVGNLTKLRRPLELEITRLKADVENKVAEIQLKAEEAAMWEQRVQQLLARYGKVDVEEYKRVEDQLKQLQASMKDTVPRAELAKAEARVKEVEDIARKKVAQDYHHRTVSNLEQQLTTAKKAAGSHDAQAKAEIARLNALVKEKTDQAAELEAGKAQAEERAGKHEIQSKRYVAMYNPERIKLSEWKAQRNVEMQGFQQSKEFLAALKDFLPSGNGPEDLHAKLQTDSSRIASLEEQLQQAGKDGPEAASLRESLEKCVKDGRELQIQYDALSKAHTASQQRLEVSQKRGMQLEAKISELEETVKALSVTPSSTLSTQQDDTAVAPAHDPEQQVQTISQDQPLTDARHMPAAAEEVPSVPTADQPGSTVLEKGENQQPGDRSLEEATAAEDIQGEETQQQPPASSAIIEAPVEAADQETVPPSKGTPSRPASVDVPASTTSQAQVQAAVTSAPENAAPDTVVGSLPADMPATVPQSMSASAKPASPQAPDNATTISQEAAAGKAPSLASVQEPQNEVQRPLSLSPDQLPQVEMGKTEETQVAEPQESGAAAPVAAVDVMTTLRQQALQQRQRAVNDVAEASADATNDPSSGEVALKRPRPEAAVGPAAKRPRPAEEEQEAIKKSESKLEDPVQPMSTSPQDVEGAPDDMDSGEEAGDGDDHEEEEEDDGNQDMPGLPHPETESRSAPQDPSLPTAQNVPGEEQDEDQGQREAAKERRSERQKKRTPIAWTGGKKEAPTQPQDSSPPAGRGNTRGRGRTRGAGRGRRGPATE